MKKNIYSVCIVIILCVFSFIISGSRASASGTANIVEINVEDDNIILYVKGIESEIQSVKGIIASESVENIRYSKLSQADVPIKTLILIDTSLSIKEAEQEHFIRLLINLIDKKTVNESFAIASYGEKIDYKCDYNSDRWELIKSLDSIEYKKQKTYLIEILYNLINEFESTDEDCFYRIIVFSDGADSNDAGVTMNELFALIGKSPYPIYAIGSEYGSNADKLNELYSISRTTNANYSNFTSESNLDEVEEFIDTIDNYTRIELTPSKEIQDGIIKNIRLDIKTSDSTYTISSDVRMNMHISKSEEDSLDIKDAREATEDLKFDSYDEGEVSEAISVADNEKTNNSMFGESRPEGFKDNLLAKIEDIPIIGYIFIALAVIIIILIIIILISSRRKDRKGKREKKDKIMDVDFDIESDGMTEIVKTYPSEHQITGTQYLFASENRIRIKLKDKSNAQIYEKYIEGIITIGRSIEKNIIAITQEPSVSSEHCKIYLQGTEVYIEDKNSSNHTLVNSNKIDTPTLIKTGDTITLGRVNLEVTIYNF